MFISPLNNHSTLTSQSFANNIIKAAIDKCLVDANINKKKHILLSQLIKNRLDTILSGNLKFLPSHDADCLKEELAGLLSTKHMRHQPKLLDDNHIQFDLKAKDISSSNNELRELLDKVITKYRPEFIQKTRILNAERQVLHNKYIHATFDNENWRSLDREYGIVSNQISATLLTQQQVLHSAQIVQQQIGQYDQKAGELYNQIGNDVPPPSLPSTLPKPKPTPQQQYSYTQTPNLFNPAPQQRHLYTDPNQGISNAPAQPQNNNPYSNSYGL